MLDRDQDMILMYHELAHMTHTNWAMSTAKNIGSLKITMPTIASQVKSGTRVHHRGETRLVLSGALSTPALKSVKMQAHLQANLDG